MKDFKTYYYKKMPDSRFCVDIRLKDDLSSGNYLKAHWHEHMQLFYFTEGRARLECNQLNFHVSAGSIAVINSNELHFLESLSDDLKFYVIRIDSSFLFSNQVDLCQTKYLAPLSQNLILFQNLINGDETVLYCVESIIREYQSKELGYELAVKSLIYRLIVLLLRGYIRRILSSEELNNKVYNLRRFDSIFQEIKNRYSEKISLAELSGKLNISVYHFCRIFKQITGKTTTEYINGVRLKKAASLLGQSDDTVTEIAMKCGFDSVNYFSRIFKGQYSVSPTDYRKAHWKEIQQEKRG